MAIPRKKTRGLQDVPTLSGRVDQAFVPYKAYMRISCLEMEKDRRNKERESAMCRVRNIDARFKEIEAEKANIIKTLNGELSYKSGKSTSNKIIPESGQEASGIRIRY